MDYWIIINDTEQGPYTLEQLAIKDLTPDTPVWCEGMADWLPAKRVDELIPLLPQPPAVPIQVPPVPETETCHTPQPAQTDKAVQPLIYAPANAIPAGYVAITPAEAKCPPTYLAGAIICTILCFLPMGICAIICSIKTSGHFRAGRMEKASRMSERTALFIILSIVAALIWMPFSVVLAMI